VSAPTVALRDVCISRTGVRNPTQNADEPFRYVDISAVDNIEKRITAAQTLLGKQAPSRARNRILAGDVLVSTTRPNLNAVAMVPDELDDQICSTGFCVLRAGPQLVADYLFQFVQAPAFVESLSDLVKGALYPAVNDSQVLDQRIPLPPPIEQARIAALLKESLSAVDAARRAAEDRLAAAESLPTAYLSEVFEGCEARAWTHVALGDLARTCSGSTPPRGRPEYFGGDIPWVKTGELKDGLIGAATPIEETVTDLALRECSLPLLPVGTLLVAMYGQGQTRGRTGLLAREATTNQACFAILPDARKFSSQFLQFWFRASYMRLRALTENRGGNQPNLNGVLLRELEIALPSIAEQQRIANALSAQLDAAESLTARCREELTAVTALRAAALRTAFNGEL
jgi:type I restriction enzyme S subunit